MTGSTNTHPGLSIDTDAEVLLDSECSVTINAKTNLILHKLTLHTFDCHNLKFSKFTYLSLTQSKNSVTLDPELHFSQHIHRSRCYQFCNDFSLIILLWLQIIEWISAIRSLQVGHLD